MLTFGRKQALTSTHTLKNYRIALRDYLEWAWPAQAMGPRVEILKATREDLARYVATLQLGGSHLEVIDGQGASLEPGTIALRIAGIRQLHKAYGFLELPFSSVHALQAGTYDQEHKDPIDRALAAQAQVEQLTLLSKDALLDQFGVSRIW